MGVGRAVAEFLVANGAKVVVNGRTPEKVEEVVKVLLDQAKVAEGEAIGDPSFYAEKISEYILKSLS